MLKREEGMRSGGARVGGMYYAPTMHFHKDTQMGSVASVALLCPSQY